MSIVSDISTGNGRGKNRILTLRCDDCQIVFVNKFDNNRAVKFKNHFCSKSCSSLSLKNGALRKSTEDSMIKKFGTKSFTSTNEFKNKVKNIFLEKYGVEKIGHSKLVQDKRKKTCLEKYGTECYAGSPDWESKLDRQSIAEKAWITKIENGSCSKSKPEEKLNLLLIEKFGKENVERQKLTIKQWIDFYITSLDIYIQVDGVYWHGLNRDIEIIKEGKTSQDIKIYKQILRDRKMDKYMKDNGMKIIRITDEQINSLSDKEIINLLGVE